jgi:hypothetical protein
MDKKYLLQNQTGNRIQEKVKGVEKERSFHLQIKCQVLNQSVPKSDIGLEKIQVTI